MREYIPYFIAAGIAALVIGGFVLGRVIERKGMQATNLAYERLLVTRDHEYSDLLDRFFQTKRQPPQGTDLLARDEENRLEEKERRSGPRRVTTSQVGAVDRARSQMAAKEKRDLETQAG